MKPEDAQFWNAKIEPVLQRPNYACTIWTADGGCFWLAGYPGTRSSRYSIREMIGGFPDYQWNEGWWEPTEESGDERNMNLTEVFGKRYKRLWGAQEGTPVLLI